MSLKIANLGRQIRDSREIFSALKDNVDQLMSKLQDGLMLFARDSRVVLVSAPVEGFWAGGAPNCWATRCKKFSTATPAGRSFARFFRTPAAFVAARI